jgi:pSer/pThr/pTyr-binding forkhead associated (FHA) protein
VPQLVLDLLKWVFLILLYLFVFRAVRAIYLELRPPTARRPARQRSAAPAPSRPPSRKQKKAPTKATVVEGSRDKGRSFPLGKELLIGRADKCQLVLDDTYVSQMHARIFPRGDGVVIEDLGSTNGTYLNRQRITSATEVQRGDRVKIGKTVLEMRK